MLTNSPQTKKFLFIVGAVLGGILGIAVLFVSCSAAVKFALKERPSFNVGTVIERDYDHAWTEFGFRQQYSGESCTQIGDVRSCTPQYITVPYTIHHPEQWDIKIRNCNVAKKDGTIWVDKEGHPKCFTKWVGVDETSYNRVKTGSEWTG